MYFNFGLNVVFMKEEQLCIGYLFTEIMKRTHTNVFCLPYKD